MNARERVLCTLNMEEPDLVPWYSTVDPRIFGFYSASLGSTYAQDATQARMDPESDSFARHLRVQEAIIKMLDLDFMNIFVLFDPNHNVMIDEEHYVNEWGRLHTTKLIGGISDAYVDGYLTTPEKYREFRKTKPTPVTDWRMKTVRETKKIAEANDLFLLGGAGSIVEVVMEAVGISNFCRHLYTNPAFIDEIIRDSALWTLEVGKAMADEGVDGVVIYDDYAFHSGPIYSVKHFRKHVLPWVKRVVGELRKRGLHVFQHACGDIRPLMEGIIEAGYEAIEPLEITAGVTIPEMKEKWGDRITLIGNVSLNTLVLGTPEETAKETEECIRAGAPSGGYMLGASHGIYFGCKPENVLAMASARKKFGKYPL